MPTFLHFFLPALVGFLLALALTLKMEAVYSSKALGSVRTTQHHNPDIKVLQNNSNPSFNRSKIWELTTTMKKKITTGTDVSL
jgi:hypothetical protein